MLKIDSLSKIFGDTRALDDISLTFRQGEMVGVIGRSGAGKSTLLRTLNRLHEPTSGRIAFDGLDITALKGTALREWRRRCAMIFQQFNLVNRLDVLTNVLVGRTSYQPTLRSVFKLYTPQERALALTTLERVEMASFLMQRTDTLSGGQQQRVAIARALVQEPSIVLADEPIASLDPRNAARVMDTLRDINKRDGITVICNLHTLDTARSYCDRVIGMAQGRIVFDGSPDRLDIDTVREIYGVEASEAFSEGITSTSVRAENAPASIRGAA
jgi:phosphonate transport system ATP-binding protein